jgi:hypothetical protein
MIYVVGTGRCGTTKYAQLHNLLHEPIGIRKRLPTRRGLIKRLKERMRRAKKLGKNGVSDFRQSFCIEEIAKVDKDAEFVWLIRNPNDCIGSFLRRGWYAGEDIIKYRIYPEGGFPEEYTHKQRVGWYWITANRHIENTILPYNHKVINTDNICKHKNKYVYNIELSEEESAYWERLKEYI